MSKKSQSKTGKPREEKLVSVADDEAVPEETSTGECDLETIFRSVLEKRSNKKPLPIGVNLLELEDLKDESCESKDETNQWDWREVVKLRTHEQRVRWVQIKVDQQKPKNKKSREEMTKKLLELIPFWEQLYKQEQELAQHRYEKDNENKLSKEQEKPSSESKKQQHFISEDTMTDDAKRIMKQIDWLFYRADHVGDSESLQILVPVQSDQERKQILAVVNRKIPASPTEYITGEARVTTTNNQLLQLSKKAQKKGFF